VFTIEADWTGAIPFNLGGAIIGAPNNTDILPVRFPVTALNGGIKLYKKGAFASDSQAKHLICLKILDSAFIKNIATFVAYIGDKQFLLFIHEKDNNAVRQGALIVLQLGSIAGIGICNNGITSRFLVK
jgi:hypothetical protein